MSEAQGQGPKTWWAGESSPEDKRNAQAGMWMFGLSVLILCPLGIVTAGTAYLAFTRWRIRWTVIGQFTLLLSFILGITGLLTKSFANYVPAVLSVVNSFGDEEVDTVSVLMKALAVTAPAALVIGGIAGTLYCAFRWYRRAHWEEATFRLTPWQWYKKRQNIRNIREDKKGPQNGGTTLGVSPEGERVLQTEAEASAHTLVVGASGSGKTTTALMQARDHIRQGNGYIFIDLKGGNDVPVALADFAQRYGRRFQHFLFQDVQQPYTGPAVDGPSYYDPLARGDASRRKDMLIAGRKWSEEYYKIITSSYLQVAFNVMIGSPPAKAVDAFTDIINLLNPGTLAERARHLPQNPYYDEVRDAVHKYTARRLDKSEQSAIDGMSRELQTIRGSIAGQWLRLHEDNEKNINIYRAAERGDVVVFSLDALGYPETARLIANLIISDLKTVTGDLNAQPVQRPIAVFIDEFSAMDSEGITGLINKSRSAGMPISLATQALGDLRRIDPAFMEQLFGIVNSFVIHRTNTLDDAETLSGVIGKEHKWEVRLGVEHTSGIFGSIGKGSATGQGMLDKVEDYIISPNIIQNLGAGEIVYVAKSPKAHVTQVQVVAEDKGLTASGISAPAPQVHPTVPVGASSPYVSTPSENSYRTTGTNDVPQRPGTSLPPPSAPDIRPTTPSTGMLGGRDLRAALGRESASTTPATTQVERPTSGGIPKRPGLPPKPPTTGTNNTSQQQGNGNGGIPRRPAPRPQSGSNIPRPPMGKKPTRNDSW